jgi:hypothetical protein
MVVVDFLDLGIFDFEEFEFWGDEGAFEGVV